MIAALATLWLAACVDRPPAAPPAFPADADVEERLRFVGERAGALVIDGDPSDWAGVPAQAAPDLPFEPADPALDLIRTAVIAAPDALLLRLDTAGAPDRAARSYWVDLDLAGSPIAELRIGLRHGRALFARVYDGREMLWEGEVAGAEVAVGKVIEARLPWAVLAEVLAAAGRSPPLSGQDARPWVRVTPFSWRREPRGRADHGASAATYRLDARALDAPPPGPEAESVVLPLPLEGKWLVLQGAHSEFTHAGRWAYDLVITDAAGHTSAPRRSPENARHYAWGAPVRAPVDGVVIRAVSDQPDHPAWQGTAEKRQANQVHLDIGAGLGLSLIHFQQGSVVVLPGAQVPAGTALGLVGDSGRSNRPHLHLALWRLAEDRTAPLAVSHVWVGLNPGPDDPWRRRVERWTLREGYYIESVQ